MKCCGNCHWSVFYPFSVSPGCSELSCVYDTFRTDEKGTYVFAVTKAVDKTTTACKFHSFKRGVPENWELAGGQKLINNF